MKHLALLPVVLISLALGSAPLAIAQQPSRPTPAPNSPVFTSQSFTSAEATPPPKPDAPKPPASDPSADPFVRDGKSAPAAPSPTAETFANIYGLVEYIEVPREAWLAWSAAHPIKGDATALRAEVQKWIAAGQAKPTELACLPTKTGQRTVIESIVERRFPTGFYPAEPTPVPITFETRNTHLTFEWEPVLRPDSFVDSNLVPQLTAFCGEEQWTPAERHAARPDDGGQPRFFTHKLTLSMTSAPSQPMLLQVTTPPDETGKPRDEVRLLLFFRTAPATVKAPAAPAKEPVPDKPTGRGWHGPMEPLAQVPAQVSGTFEVERLEVTLSDLNAWFAGQPLDTATGGLRAAAREWIHAGRGREIDRQPNPFASGQRCLFEAVEEFRYPKEYSVERTPLKSPEKSPEAPKNGVPPGPDPVPVQTSENVWENPFVTPSVFETRQLGYSVELEPVVSPDGRYIDLNIVCSDTRHCGNTVLHRAELPGKVFDKPVPDVEQPIFGTMKVTTSLTLGNGEPALLAIHTPADEQGRPQPERKILTFVTVRN